MQSRIFILNILEKIKKIDWIIFLPMLFITTFGLLTMSSLENSDPIFWRQIVLIIISFSLFIIFSFFDYRVLKNSYLVISIYAFLVFLLALIFVFGYVSKGGNRWFNLGAFFIGPSEPMKLVLILVLAKFFSKRHMFIANIKNVLLSFIYLAVPAVLVLLQPDLSTSIIFCIIWFGMLLASGLSRKHIIWFSIIAITIALALWNFYFMDYQKSRILNFVNPTQDLKGTGWNAYQSMIAVGSGGAFGKGVGYGTQSRLGFLPEHETDFIFASFLEEWGMSGGIIVFILFSIIIFSLAKKASKGNSNFESLFIVGVSIWFVAQLSFNIGMNIGIFPVTGIPLPFMSHGGSHLLVESIALGICVGMSRYGKAAHASKFKNEFLGLE